jgi:hypothetical protein
MAPVESGVSNFTVPCISAPVVKIRSAIFYPDERLNGRATSVRSDIKDGDEIHLVIMLAGG